MFYIHVYIYCVGMFHIVKCINIVEKFKTTKTKKVNIYLQEQIKI